jgi:predicted kinase
MPAPQDHIGEQESSPDQAGPREADHPREARAQSTDLQARQERLPVGHPSSPYRNDGSRKPSPPDLAQHELPLPDELQSNAEQPGPDLPTEYSANTGSDGPGERNSRAEAERSLSDTVERLSDAAYAEHTQKVRDRIERARADGLASDEQHTIDPDREVWSESREALHDEIIDEHYERAVNVPNEHRAIIAGGLTGAGKSTVLAEHAGIDRSRYLTIDPDEIKAELARRGMIPSVEGLSPMEASDLVHEESSHIAKRLARRAQADGKNVIWDITMSSRSSTERRIENLRSAGYVQVDGIFVDIPIATCGTRAEARHKTGHAEYSKGKGEGGRFNPPELIRAKADQMWGSVNRKTFEEVKHLFDSWSIYDNSVDGRPPRLVDSSDMRKRLYG